MANSPTPSCSTVDPHNGTDPAPQKKKRTRRKPKKVKIVQEEKCIADKVTQLLEFIPNFVIEAVKEPAGVFYRQRDKLMGPINLRSFIQNNRVPCVFETGCHWDPDSTLELLETFKGVSITTKMCLPSSGKSSPTKKRTTPKGKKKRKKVVAFPNYLSEEEVAEGLKTGQLIKGFIRINPKNSKEAYVGNTDISKTDYVIDSVLDRNRAFDGDEVVLRLKPVSDKTSKNDKRKITEVVYISQTVHPRTAVGYLESMGPKSEVALFTPRDKRIPKMKINKTSWPSGFYANPELYKNVLFLVRVIVWTEVKYALGAILETIGLSGDLKVESLAILREFCLDPTPYGDDIKQFLPKSLEIPKKEFSYREDFRKDCIFTIDPITARDLDDAVSCKELPNGNFEVGVHISDASFFLKEKTKLDDIVKNKATTIYMVETAYHMLPIELCFHCSLLPGTDKLTFSVVWELTPDGAIVKRRFTRSVINSCCQLAYEHAQSMIDEPDRKFAPDELPKIFNGFTAEDLSRVVNNLQKIAVNLREKRRQNGSLKIDQVKIGFSLDAATGEPNNFEIYENKPSHRLIEEFMLLANMSVAEYINEIIPDLAFLRMHEPPKPPMMVDLQKNLETIGMHIDISSSGGIQSSLNKYASNDFLGESRMAVLNYLFAKPMKRARYFCAGALPDTTPYTHYALSMPIYTHFTSPIRRYADIMVHRLLAASLNYCEKPEWDPEDVKIVAETCNVQKYNAKRAQDASSDLYLAHYIEKNQPYIQDGVVVDTRERSVDVLVLNSGTVVRIYTDNIGENVTCIAEEIKIQKKKNDENGKKWWKIFVNYPKTDEFPAMSIVLEIFTLVKVSLNRKAKTNKLEAKLLRPLPSTGVL